MTMALWDLRKEEPLMESYNHHTEFVLGMDFNMFLEGQVASCCKCQIEEWTFSRNSNFMSSLG